MLCFQIHNNLPYTMDVFYKLGKEAPGKCGEIKPDGFLNVPIQAVYTAPYELFFKPHDVP